MYTILQRVSRLKVQLSLVFIVFTLLVSHKGYSQTDCTSTSFPVMQFADRSNALTSSMQTDLSSIASQIKNHPDCRYVILGNGGTTKFDQEMAWLRINAVESYLVDHEGINNTRFIIRINVVQSGPINEVSISGAASDDSGPSTISEPSPGLIGH